MTTKELLVLLLSSAFLFAACGPGDHGPHHTHEDAGDVSEDADCRGDRCGPPASGIELAVRPGSAASASRIAWYPVDGATRYQLVMNRLDEKGRSNEVFSLETKDLHAQVPQKHRNTSRASLQVKAYGDGDEAIEESDTIPFACAECGYKPTVCAESCEAPSFGYRIYIFADADTYANAQAQITGSGHFIAYSYDDYVEAWNLNENNFRNRTYYVQTISGATSDPVYDRFCGGQLTGEVYFVQADAGVYQYAVDQLMTTGVFANDGEAMCGTYTGIGGMNILFNSTSDISPPLTCPSNCNLDTGGGGTGWPGPWEEIDPELFPTPIEIAEDIFDIEPSQPGWFDDIPLAPILNELADHGFNPPDDEPLAELAGLSIRKAVREVRDPTRRPEGRIEVDLNRLEREGRRYIDELTRNLEDGELYILTRYHGGVALRPMALVHRSDL
jgi:hypothetical protein